MAERNYQAKLIQRIKARFPGCEVIKNDANYIQGIPDLVVLYRDKWAMLEVKDSHTSPSRPNQEYYIERFGEMSYAAIIFPENEEEVLNELQRSFQSRRKTRVS